MRKSGYTVICRPLDLFHAAFTGIRGFEGIVLTGAFTADLQSAEYGFVTAERFEIEPETPREPVLRLTGTNMTMISIHFPDRTTPEVRRIEYLGLSYRRGFDIAMVFPCGDLGENQVLRFFERSLENEFHAGKADIDTEIALVRNSLTCGIRR